MAILIDLGLRDTLVSSYAFYPADIILRPAFVLWLSPHRHYRHVLAKCDHL